MLRRRRTWQGRNLGITSCLEQLQVHGEAPEAEEGISGCTDLELAGDRGRRLVHDDLVKRQTELARGVALEVETGERE